MKRLIVSAALLVAAGCATQQIHMSEPRRVVGTEEAVRIDAEITGDQLGPNTQIPITYVITNQRQEVIAIADILPEASYDAETQTVTVSVGSEVPGENLLPRLIPIAPGEKKSFTAVATVHIAMPNVGSEMPIFRLPNALRLKVNFLSDTKPFTQLVNISEKAVHDPKLADALFPAWMDANEAVYTNSVPMRWAAAQLSPAERGMTGSTAGRRRRRG